VYNTTNATFYVRDENTGGIAEHRATFGPGGSVIPVTGNWTGVHP